jgi:uncharacterized protein
VALLLDAGALYAQADRADRHHAAVAEILRAEREPLVTSALAVAEADYLMLTRLGIEVELAFVEDLAEGTFSMGCLTRPELRVALGVVRRYRDLAIGLADASLVVLAQPTTARPRGRSPLAGSESRATVILGWRTG